MRNRRTGTTAVPLASVRLDLLLRRLAELDSVGAVDLLADDLDLLLNRLLEVVQELELRLALAHGDKCLCECFGASTAFGPVVAHYRGIGTAVECELTNELELSLGIRAVGTDQHAI